MCLINRFINEQFVVVLIIGKYNTTRKKKLQIKNHKKQGFKKLRRRSVRREAHLDLHILDGRPEGLLLFWGSAAGEVQRVQLRQSGGIGRERGLL